MAKILKAAEHVKGKFWPSTLSFLFIIIYVNVFPILFGPENSIVAVIFTIMMTASMVRDWTATPIRHLLIQSALLVWMALAAYWVTAWPQPASFLVNFLTLLAVLYLYTYEYSSHMYFPYILSYLFLVFISPVGAERLPSRLAAMVAGAVSIMAYQWLKGRRRVVLTARDVLSGMIDDVREAVRCKAGEEAGTADYRQMHHRLCVLSRTVYERRKRVLCISDAGYAMVAAGRGLEHLLILVEELPGEMTAQKRAFLSLLDGQLETFRHFLQQELTEIPPVEETAFLEKEEKRTAEHFLRQLAYIRDRLLHMTDPQNRFRYRKTALSLRVRLAAALDFSPVRAVYAVRTALLLSLATALVQQLALPHGKWLLFTLASVSLPYADDVPEKIRKRFWATVIGGLASVVIYSAVPSAAGRTAAMMLSGYLSFYFTDYMQTFACSTVGALGGAVFMEEFGLSAVGGMFVIRLGYIIAGVLAGYAVNCLIFPYKRAEATRQLWEKYKTVTELLTRVCRMEKPDPQLYYHLVIQAYLQEEKLSQNAGLEEWEEFPALLRQCRERVREAHRTRIAGRSDAPLFDAGHLV